MDDIERLKTLAGVANSGSMTEYHAEESGSNISATAQEKIEKQKADNIQPGTEEWFRLWFTLPSLTNTTPFD